MTHPSFKVSLKLGNVKLSPHLLGDHQKFIAAKLKSQTTKPVFFVFHGGSGSEKHEIKVAMLFQKI